MNGLSTVSSTEIKYPPNVGANRGVSPETTESERLYESKHDKKLVRILTVILYMISVSLGAILLSLYYIFLWRNPHTHHYLMVQNKPNQTIDDTVPPMVLELDSNPKDTDVYEDANLQNIITAFPKGARGIPPIGNKEDYKHSTKSLKDEEKDTSAKENKSTETMNGKEIKILVRNRRQLQDYRKYNYRYVKS